MGILFEEIERVLLSAALGAVIGAEREWQGKSAGFRTVMLVCIGSALFTIVSYKMGAGISPDRIASNIVTGIGFIGAGLIFKDEQTVRGLTTAATVWSSAAIGVSIGIGEYWLGAASTAIMWVVLRVLHYFEHYFEKFSVVHHYVVKYKHVPGEEYLAYDEFFKEKAYKLLSSKTEKVDNSIVTTWVVRASQEKHDVVVRKILEDQRIAELDY
ncbi:MAG: MgtC/SapB family protein [Sphingobacteriales bacterium]|nr:MAG: MgtC/SapB family protein [Sphingobacteriales bacterium]